ncbi:MAG: hypothetical protein PF904_05690 [Kiritimatiellae bacterium]|jgi:FSR family fosmidomycin resistance protein-like MFS transporter|nr:hypothetical protein [Kiritimatiellia bacterium]
MNSENKNFKTRNVISIASAHLLHDTFSAFYAPLIPLLITAAISWWGLEGTWRLIPIGFAASLILFINLRKIDKAHLQPRKPKDTASVKETLCHIGPVFSLIAPIVLFRGFSKTALTTFLPAYMVHQGCSIKMAAGAMGLIFFASTPVFMAMVHDLNTDRPTFTNAMFMTISFAASSIVALLVGFFADWYGFVRTYQITALLSACAIPFTLALKNPGPAGPSPHK